MNYFLTPEGLEPTGLKPNDLMRHLLYRATEQDISQFFRDKFAEVVLLPNILFRKNWHSLEELGKVHEFRNHVLPRPDITPEECVYDAANHNIVYLISGIGYFNNEPGIFKADMYTMDSSKVNAAMRRVLIDEVLETL